MRQRTWEHLNTWYVLYISPSNTIIITNTHTYTQAPELCSKEARDSRKGNYTAKVDVYAFGMMLYEAVERQRPWHELNFVYKVFKKVEKGERPPLTEDRLSKAPDEVVKLMKRCWHQDPERRPNFKEVGHCIHDVQTILHRDTMEDLHGPTLLDHDDSHDPDHVKGSGIVVEMTQIGSTGQGTG